MQVRMWYKVLIALIFSNVSKLFILLFFATYHILFFNLINCLQIKSITFKTMFLNAFGFNCNSLHVEFA